MHWKKAGKQPVMFSAKIKFWKIQGHIKCKGLDDFHV